MQYSERSAKWLSVVLLSLPGIVILLSVGLTWVNAVLCLIAWLSLVAARFSQAWARRLFTFVSASLTLLVILRSRPAFDLIEMCIFVPPIFYTYLLNDKIATVGAAIFAGLPLLMYVGTEPPTALIGVGCGVVVCSSAWSLLFRMIHGLRRDKAVFQRLSVTDQLTGLPVLRRAIEYGRDALAQGRRLGVITIDLDGFKNVNDTFGHLAGNEVLVQFAGQLKAETERLTGGGLAARLGGDEFIVMIADDREIPVADLAERLRDGLAKVRYRPDPDLPDAALPLAFSVGVAVGQAPASVESIVQTADQQMYYRKYDRTSQWNPFSEGDPRLDERYVIWLRLLAEKDLYTFVHSQLASRLAAKFARWLGYSSAFADDLAKAAWLHDMGKLFVPSLILRKPGALTENEYALVRRHVSDCLSLACCLDLPEQVTSAILYHHERWDGAGYPTGATGAKTPLAGRILQIVDSFAAMTVKRVYRRPLTAAEALDEIERSAGTQLDPNLVKAFVLFATTSEYPEARPRARNHLV